VARRYDSAPLSKATRLDSGAVRASARLTRSGVFAYRQADGSMRREYRPAEEIFAPSVLEALKSAPVTLDHPGREDRGRVTSESWGRLAIGHVGDDVRADETRKYAEGSVVISDAAAIARVDSGARDLSIGFDLDLEMTPGVSPEGEPYDAIQRRIRPNHVAIVPRGRAGSEVGLRLDAFDDEIPNATKDPAPMKIKIAGKEFDAGSPEAEAAIAALSARADAAEGETRAVKSRAMRERVRAAKIEFRADAEDNAVMLDVIKRIAPDVDLASASPDYVAGAFAVAIAIALKAMGDAVEKPKPPTQPGAPDAPPATGAAGARADAIDAAYQKLRADRAEDATAQTADDIRDRVIAAQRKQAFAGL
tara:strand:- start:4170 stop:5261 length:1092 start_codon:yes stop_codon:yes gene_type:complete